MRHQIKRRLNSAETSETTYSTARSRIIAAAAIVVFVLIISFVMGVQSRQFIIEVGLEYDTISFETVLVAALVYVLLWLCAFACAIWLPGIVLLFAVMSARAFAVGLILQGTIFAHNASAFACVIACITSVIGLLAFALCAVIAIFEWTRRLKAFVSSEKSIMPSAFFIRAQWSTVLACVISMLLDGVVAPLIIAYI